MAFAGSFDGRSHLSSSQATCAVVVFLAGPLVDNTTPRKPSAHFLHLASPGSSAYDATPLQGRHESTAMDDNDSRPLKKPMPQATQVGWDKRVPTACVKWPAWHFVCDLHFSGTVDEADGVALKKPSAHALHVGGRDADPATDVNLPASHFVCAVHTALSSANLLVGALARKKPLAQA